VQQADLLHSFRKTYTLSGTDTSSFMAEKFRGAVLHDQQ